MSETNNTTVPQEAAAGPNLNLADLVNVLQVINTCSSRGAFQANELSSVGGLYDRLHTFLSATGALDQPATTPETQPEPQA
jgi:hypothetical protein